MEYLLSERCWLLDCEVHPLLVVAAGGVELVHVLGVFRVSRQVVGQLVILAGNVLNVEIEGLKFERPPGEFGPFVLTR